MPTDLGKLFYTPARCQQDVALALEFLYARVGRVPAEADRVFGVSSKVRRAARRELASLLTRSAASPR